MRQRRVGATVSRRVYEVQAEFRFVLRQFLRFAETAARRAGLTPQQYQALLAVHGFPGRDRVTVGELATRLQVHPHSAVGLANRLVQRGLARRERSASDQRRVFIRLTPRGVRLLARVAAATRGALRGLRPRFILLLTHLARLERRRS